MATFFDKMAPKLQTLQPDSTDRDVDPPVFLAAITGMLPFFDMLGKPFTPVKSDINGNVTTLQKKYDSNPEKYSTFRAMLEEEIATTKDGKKGPACVSLLWLKRALQYIQAFMALVIEDSKSGAKTENLVPFCKKAYEETLKQYHGWLIKKVFAVVSHATPWRRDFMKTLSYGKEGLDDEVILHMDKFAVALAIHITVFDALLQELQLDSNEKV